MASAGLVTVQCYHMGGHVLCHFIPLILKGLLMLLVISVSQRASPLTNAVLFRQNPGDSVMRPQADAEGCNERLGVDLPPS